MVSTTYKTNLMGQIGVRGYACVEYPNFAVMSYEEGAYVMYDMSSWGPFVLDGPLQTVIEAVTLLTSFLEQVEEIEELSERFLKKCYTYTDWRREVE